MVYREQEFGAFLDARDVATDMLQEGGFQEREVSFTEAVILQGASHLVAEGGVFHVMQLSRLVNLQSGSVGTIVKRLEDYGLVEKTTEGLTSKKGGTAYRPTAFGADLFALFQPSGEDDSIPHR